MRRSFSFQPDDTYIPERTLPTIHHNGRPPLRERPPLLGLSKKYLSLLVLVLHNSALVLMMRYSRITQRPGEGLYIPSTAVFFAEVLKILVCLGLLWNKKRTFGRFLNTVKKDIIGRPEETLNMLIPSGLYALQNNLLYVALSNLDAATFQVTYQMKILATAAFSVALLGRKLSQRKWFSLLLLMVGVTLVQLQTVNTTSPPVSSADSLSDSMDDDFDFGPIDDEDLIDHDSTGGATFLMAAQNPVIGLVAVITSCLSSGFAGCYFEKILKGSEFDTWVRNIQLGLSGSLFSFLAMMIYDRDAIMEGGLLQGYNGLTWMVVLNQALGGLLVAVVVKFADNILKGFATSISIIISGLFSFYFFDFLPSFQFISGACIVILAGYLYGKPDRGIRIR